MNLSFFLKRTYLITLIIAFYARWRVTNSDQLIKIKLIFWLSKMKYKLEILGESPTTYGRKRVVARCACGNLKTYAQDHVRAGNIISCGCRPRDSTLTHGMRKTLIYETWAGMKNRCTNPSHSRWHRYGGRGIAVCERWQKFENFYKDMGDKPKGKQLDRIDNNSGYSPDNCRWATPKENCNNKENCLKIEFGCTNLTMTELAQLGLISRRSMSDRWHKYYNAWHCLFPPN